KAKLRDCVIIEPNKGQRQIRQGTANVDRRKPRCEYHVSHPSIVHARNDAIAAPVLQPGRRPLAQPMWFKVDRPRTMLLMVAGDAAQKSAAVFPRRLNQQCDVRQMGHSFTFRSSLTEKWNLIPYFWITISS